MSLASALQAVFGTQARFALPSAATCPPGLTIRPLQPADQAECLRIYLENEPGRFPSGVVPDFQRFLARHDYLKLACCLGDRLTAVGGIGLARGLRSLRAWLIYGLVDPALHRKGIGTALLLARLSTLPRPVRPVRLLLSNVPGSVSFFSRFGFQLQGQMPVRPGGELIDVCSAMLEEPAWEACRAAVTEHLPQLSSLEVPQIGMRPRSPNKRWGP
jgi:hypothetical protein